MALKRNKKSFTLIETIAAALLLSLSVVVLAGISIRSLQMARSITVYEQAWDLADRQLTIVDYIGVRKYILSGPTEGQYKGDGIKFDWTLKISETTLDFLYDVTVTVGWVEQRGYKKIEIQTRLSGY
jgi:hypothetical protein